MSTQGQAPFTEEEIGQLSAANAKGMSLAVLAHAKARGESPDVAVRWMGHIYAPGWSDLRGQGAFIALRRAALNAVSVGAQLLSLSGDEHHAEASLGAWPTDADLSFFGLSRDEAAAMFGIFDLIAASLDLRYRWERRGDEFIMESAKA